jgi:hypothetical protein
MMAFFAFYDHGVVLGALILKYRHSSIFEIFAFSAKKSPYFNGFGAVHVDLEFLRRTFFSGRGLIGPNAV